MGDVLVGADGIWSKIRKQIVGESQPHYSEYTCYTGACAQVGARKHTGERAALWERH